MSNNELPENWEGTVNYGGYQKRIVLKHRFMSVSEAPDGQAGWYYCLSIQDPIKRSLT